MASSETKAARAAKGGEVMGAPTLGEAWQSGLRLLPKDWNSYGSKEITQAAIKSVESFATVPCSGGGIQLEVHRDGWDIEICIDAEGRIESVLTACEPAKGAK